MTARLQQIAGAAFVASVLLIETAFALLLMNSGDTSGPVSAIAAVSLIAFLAGMIALRQSVTGQPVRPLALASVVIVTGTVIGTTTHISGVFLAVPLVAIAIFLIQQSRWRLGETGILAMVCGLGTGLAYVLEAALDPDTGSYGDQGAVALTVLGVALSSVAVALLSELSRMVRVPLMTASALGGISFLGLMGAFGGAAPLLLGLTAGVLGGTGWIRLGMNLWRHGAGYALASEPRQTNADSHTVNRH